MHRPLREQIKLDDRWQVQPAGDRSARVFVPGPWNGKRVALVPGAGESWSGASLNEQPLQLESSEYAWLAGSSLAPGQWNVVSTPDGSVSQARLEAGPHLYIASLEGTAAGEHRLSVRVRLSNPAPARCEEDGGEAPCFLGAGLLNLIFTLTTTDGRQAGGMEVLVARKTRDLCVEMSVPEALAGQYRLKAALCEGDVVIDNARVDLNL